MQRMSNKYILIRRYNTFYGYIIFTKRKHIAKKFRVSCLEQTLWQYIPVTAI